MSENMPHQKIWNIIEKFGLQLLYPQDSIINWEIATGYAMDFSQAERAKIFEDPAQISQIYDGLMNSVAPLVATYFNKQDEMVLPHPVCVFDRMEWIVANIENMKFLLEPLSQAYWEALRDYLSFVYYGTGRAFRKMSELALTVYMGLVVGHLATKVLAQYDWGLPRSSQDLPARLLYFVEPNILDLQYKLNLNPNSLRLWICLHEATHSFQFEAHPWVQSHLESLWRHYLALASEAVSEVKSRLKKKPKPFSWSQYWWRQLLSPSHLETIKKIQALMCLLEGYSDFIMFRVGKELPDYQQILPVFKKRVASRDWANRLLERLIGFDIKIQQYTLGERFVSTIAEMAGIEFLNNVWQGPENLPSWEEIYNPAQWIKRI